MLAGYDIGFLIASLPVEILTRNSNRGRVLGWASVLIGLSSFLYSIPHFATSDVVPISSNNTQDILCHKTRQTDYSMDENISLWVSHNL